jgi:hypothetical protein
MKCLIKKETKKRALFNRLPLYLLSDKELSRIRGGIVVVICSGETLKASDHPGADDYSCIDGATLKPMIDTFQGGNIDSVVSL